MSGKSGPHARDKVSMSFWIDYRDARRLLQVARRLGRTRTDVLTELATAMIEREGRRERRKQAGRLR